MRIKLCAIILSVAVFISLSSCGKRNEASSPNWNPEVPQREVLREEDCMLGVYYMLYSYDDFSGMSKDRNYYNKIFESAGSLEKFEFLKKIPDEYIISTPMGTEVYLIIPADPEAHVSVYEWEMDEETFTPVKKEKPLYSSDSGAPFVLQCNYGDLFSDAEIVITDSSGEEVSWKPFISLKDGRVYNTTDGGKTVYDFTDYDQDEEYMDD